MREVVPGKDAPLHRRLGGRGQAHRQRGALGRRVGMAAPFPRIGIVGSGAVGTYYGARMALAGADVRFLMRGRPGRRPRAGIDRGRATRSGTVELRPVAAFGTPGRDWARRPGRRRPEDDASAAMPPGLVEPLLGPATAILTLQNGLGADEFLAGLFGAERDHRRPGLHGDQPHRAGRGDVLPPWYPCRSANSAGPPRGARRTLRPCSGPPG